MRTPVLVAPALTALFVGVLGCGLNMQSATPDPLASATLTQHDAGWRVYDGGDLKPTLDITVRNGSSSSIGLSFKARFIDGTGRLVREPYESCDIPAGTSLGPIRFFTFISYKDTFQSDEEFREALSNPNHPNHPTKWKVDLLAAAKGASDNEYRVIYSSALNIRR